jgi:acyl-CoA synthetase (AMP-forming)/AMP-acid ligase II
MNQTITDILRNSATLFSDSVYLKEDNGIQCTYFEFNQMVINLSSYFENIGIKKQDRIVIALDNSIVFFICYYSTLKIGAVAVPISHRTKQAKLDYIVKDSKPKILITNNNIKSLTTDSESLIDIFKVKDGKPFILFKRLNAFIKRKEKVTNLNEPNSEDIAMIIYTSGSTGKAKGIVIKHYNILFSAKSIYEYLNIKNLSTIINFLPPFFDYGLYQGILPLFFGGKVILIKNFIFVDQIFELLESETKIVLPLIPTITAKFIEYIQDHTNKNKLHVLPKIDIITSTGAIFHEKYIFALKKHMPFAKIFSMYGLTECKRVSYLDPEFVLKKPRSVGKPMHGVIVKVVQDDLIEVPINTIGKLLVIGKNVADSYWNEKELSSQTFIKYNGEKALLTNDLFVLDEDGFLYFKGRTDDVIKSGGYRISLKEVTELILDLDCVSEAILIPYKDEVYGELLEAVVVPQKGKENIENIIVKKLQEVVDNPFMIPRKIKVVTNISISENYKYIKNEENF